MQLTGWVIAKLGSLVRSLLEIQTPVRDSSHVALLVATPFSLITGEHSLESHAAHGDTSPRTA